MASVFKRGNRSHSARARGGSWYIQYVDRQGISRSRSARTTDKRAAERLANKIEAEEMLRREGVIDTQDEARADQAKQPLASLLSEYRKRLVANGRSQRYVNETLRCLERLCEGQGIVLLQDLSPARVERHAAWLTDQGRSNRTVQAMIGTAKTLTRWLTSTSRLHADPLVAVSKPSPAKDRRLRRRMLFPEEWPWLRRAAEDGPDRHGMLGLERALLYRTALTTGFRLGELRSLTRGSFVLDGPQRRIRLKSEDAKNSCDAEQHIDKDLAERLRVHCSAKLPAAKVFAVPDRTKAAKMLRADLADARNVWLTEARGNVEESLRRQQSDFLLSVNHAGEKIDFHALRHTCGAWLTIQGTHPKAIQSVMRHSTIAMTMDAYGHLLPGAEADAAEALGAIASA